MERRLLIAAALSVLLLVAWGYLFPPPAPPLPPTAPLTAESEPAPGRDPSQDLPAAAPSQEQAARAAQAESVETVEVENDLLLVTLTNRGAAALSFRLRHYAMREGDPLELLPSFAEKERPLPLSVELEDPDLARKFNMALYEVAREPVSSDQGGPGERITFTWGDGSGLWARKSFLFREGSYLIDMELEVTENGHPLPARLLLGPGFAAQEPSKGRSTYYYQGQVAVNRAGQVWRLDSGDVADKPDRISGQLRWAGLEDQYFTAVILPGAQPAEAAWHSVTLTRQSTLEGEPQAAEAAPEPLLSVSVPPSGGRLFVGPKKYTLLREYGHDLEKVVYFSSIGFLAWISKGIFLSLLWIHDNTVQNYGMAIVLSTFALRLLLFPVNQYAMVSMKKAQLQMQRLQPKVKAIRLKYKKTKDAESRTRMNQEMMDMYRSEGVNPMGGMAGCLPLLAQFPILIGFYNMLTVAIELRGAPFFGWIQDLSREDPYFVTPILMGVTMFAQQKMAMNKVKDPQQLQQQRMMLFMPVVFTFICLQMPSGMVLYWFVNNLLGMGQQWLVNRHTARLETAALKA